jgi:ribose-phosphate pyrophosphokinase
MSQLETTSSKRLQIFSGSYNAHLAKAVARQLGTDMGDAQLERFANGEVRCRLGESARGGDVFVFQAHDQPVNDAIMEQAIIIDAARRASARRITAVCPFFGYARQDRKSAGREPITAKLVVNILEAAGADRILSVDLHTGQIQGFFDGPFDHLTAMPVLLDYIKKEIGTDIVMVSPDAGRVKASERYTQALGVDLAIVHKTRSKTKANTVTAHAVIGDVEGRHCVLIDDMIDTAGTIVAAAEQVKRYGAKEVSVLTTHGVFSNPAMERLAAAPIDRVVCTDTLDQTQRPKLDKLIVLSIAPLMAHAVKAVFLDASVSELFAGGNQL